MPELMKEFLNRTNRDLAALEEKLPRLERDPSDREAWSALETFFGHVRSASPFLDMERSYSLSDAASAEIAAYKNGEKGLEILPAVLMKFQRLKKIVSSVANLGREPRETDQDLLPAQKEEASSVPKRPEKEPSAELAEKAALLNAKEKKVAEQEKALDAREEELVIRSRDLSERETFLKDRENKLFEGEQRILVSEKSLSEEYEKLRETEARLDERQGELERKEEVLQENAAERERSAADLEERRRDAEKRFKALADRENGLERKETELSALEEELVRTQSELGQKREEQQNIDERQELQRSVLDDREKALKAREEELNRLEERLKAGADGNAEAELRLQLCDRMRLISEMEEEARKSAFKYASSEKESSALREKNAVLNAENENLKRAAEESAREFEKAKSEQTNLIEQHRLLNDENVELQQELSRRKAAAEREREDMKRQNAAYEEMKDDLRAVRWPFDVGGLCGGLERLAKARTVMQSLLAKSYNVQKLSSVRTMQEASLIFKEHVADLRSRSVRGVYDFVRKTLKQKSEKYRRAVKIGWDLPEELPVADAEAENAVCRILSFLIDNSFKYAVLPPDDLVLRLKFSVKSNGTFLNFSLSDNGTEFPVNTLRANIIQAHLLTRPEVEALSDRDVLQYLFHPQVRRRSDVRGLLAACALLEVCGGRIGAKFENGLRVDFSLPVSYLFGQALGCRIGRYKVLLPLSAVVKTLSLSGSENPFARRGGMLFLEWEGMSVPVLPFPPGGSDAAEYGVVLQAGAFFVLLRVDQILDTQEIVSLHSDKADKDTPFLLPAVTLEHGSEFSFLDVSFLLRLHPLLLASSEDVAPDDGYRARTQSFLIFKSAPHTFGAVRVDAVERIDAFSEPQKDPETKAAFFESGGKKLPLRDTAPHGRFAFSKAVLVLKNSALAIQEVTDILDVPVAEENESVDFVVYNGAQIPVLSEEDQN